VRDFDTSARFHVWHSRLGLAQQVDKRVQQALRAGRGFAVVGASGSGKTSTLAAAVLATEEFEVPHLPLRLSVSGLTDNVSDPRYLAYRLVRAIAQLVSEAQQVVDRAAPVGTTVGAGSTSRLQIGAKGVQFSRELRQRTENVDFERTPDEVLASAAAALALMREHDLRPAVLLEDADGLLRLPGKSAAERRALADAFFTDGLDPLLRELAVPAAIAVQPEYRELDGFKRFEAFVDGVENVPVPSQLTEAGLRLLIAETLRKSSSVHTDSEVFDEDALAVLAHNRYSLPTIRAVIDVCAASVIKAHEEAHDRVREPDMGYAISQR
jgi:hypothetical protein